jgi:hypothetical protein
LTKVTELKELLIRVLIDRIENGETKTDSDGNTFQVPAPAQTLAVAARVVKDFSGDGEGALPAARDLSETLKKYQQMVSKPGHA